jgi:hypothetical protein
MPRECKTTISLFQNQMALIYFFNLCVGEFHGIRMKNQRDIFYCNGLGGGWIGTSKNRPLLG